MPDSDSRGAIPDHERARLEAIAGPDRPLDELVRRRVAGEPLQYLEGTASFGPIDLIVDNRVLVPRPETEGLFEIAARMVRNPEVIVDLCTGSGALALALKHRFPTASVFATDISEEAIEVAYANRHATGLEIYLAAGDLFDPLPVSILGEVDLIVANPPYVADRDYDGLPADVKREPMVALISGPTGLEVIQRIGASAAQWLRPGGVVVCEIGEKQGVSASSSFADLPAVVRQDLTSRDRYVVAVKP
jgi:release factor glutamine methyltransferase